MTVCTGMYVLYSLRTYLLQFIIEHISWPEKLLCAITDLFCLLKRCVCVAVFSASMRLLFFVIM
jgi:hypothetical protein